MFKIGDYAFPVIDEISHSSYEGFLLEGHIMLHKDGFVSNCLYCLNERMNNDEY